MGRDQLIPLGMVLSFEQQQLEWHGHAVPMKPTNAITAFFLEVEESRQEAEDAELFFSSEENEIRERSYKAVSPKEVITEQKHLSEQQKEQLHAVLSKHKSVFDGTLGCYPHKKIHIDLLDPAGQPFCHRRPYPVAFQHQKLFQQELTSFIIDEVLEPLHTPSE